MKRAESAIATAFGIIFLVLSFAVSVETIARKFWNVSLQGVDEFGGYCLAVGGSLAFTAALIRGGHIRIDILHQHLPRGVRVILNTLAILSLGLSAAVLLAMAWSAFSDSVQYQSTVQSPWATPLRYPQAVWLAALSLFAAVAALQVFRLIRFLAAGDVAGIDRVFSPFGLKDELAEEIADLQSRGVLDMIDAEPKDKS